MSFTKNKLFSRIALLTGVFVGFTLINNYFGSARTLTNNSSRVSKIYQTDTIEGPLVMHLPVREGRFWSDFTTKRWHPVDKKFKPHLAVDIAKRDRWFPNEPVLAAHDGRVEKVKKSKKGWGNRVEIRLNDSIKTRNAHLRSDILVKEGDYVRSGDTIGWVGQSGKVTGPHLHFEVIKNFVSGYGLQSYFKNEHLNPRDWVIELKGVQEGDYITRQPPKTIQREVFVLDLNSSSQTQTTRTERTTYLDKFKKFFTFTSDSTKLANNLEELLAKKEELEEELTQIQNREIPWTRKSKTYQSTIKKESYKPIIASNQTQQLEQLTQNILSYEIQIEGSIGQPLTKRQVSRLERTYGQKITERKINRKNKSPIFKYTIGNYTSKEKMLLDRMEIMTTFNKEHAGMVLFQGENYLTTAWDPRDLESQIKNYSIDLASR